MTHADRPSRAPWLRAVAGRAAGGHAGRRRVPGVAVARRAQGGRLLHLGGRSVPWRRRARRRRAGRQPSTPSSHAPPTSRSPCRSTTTSRCPPTPGPSSSRRTWWRPGSFSSRPPTRRPGAGRRGPDRSGPHRRFRWNGTRSRTATSSAPSSDRSRDRLQGPLAAFVNQAADTFDGNGDSFRQRVTRALADRRPAWGFPHRPVRHGRTCRCWSTRCRNSNEQIVQFSSHVASVSQVLADSSADLDDLGDAEPGPRRRPGLPQREQRGPDRAGRQAGRFHPAAHRSQRRHRAGPSRHAQRAGNFYNIYNPAQGTVGGLLSLPNFANPVQFICGGTFDVGA